MHRFGHAQELLLTFGLAFIIEEVVKLFFGDFSGRLRCPENLRFAAFTMFGTDYPFYRAVDRRHRPAMFVVLYAAARGGPASASWCAPPIERPQMAAALGHDVPLVFSGVFGVGAASPASPAALPAPSTRPTPTWRSTSASSFSSWSSSVAWAR